MSYILDALKKSEARRRSGQSADLAQPAPEAARRRGRWPLLVLGLMVVGAGSALGVWLAARQDAEPHTAATAVAEPSADSAPVASPPETPTTHVAIADRVRRAAGKNRQSTSAVATKSTAPAAPAASTNPAATDTTGDPGIIPGTNNEDPAIAGEGQLAGAESGTEAIGDAGVDAGVDPEAEPEADSPTEPQDDGADELQELADADPDGDPSALDELTARAIDRYEESREPPAPEPQGPPLIHELAWNFRSQLPPLTLNVHMYSDEPAQRFVLINMHRYREGDLMENGDIVVRQVVPEGVVLQMGGREFLLGR